MTDIQAVIMLMLTVLNACQQLNNPVNNINNKIRIVHVYFTRSCLDYAKIHAGKFIERKSMCIYFLSLVCALYVLFSERADNDPVLFFYD